MRIVPGIPLLLDCPQRIIGRVLRSYDGGDHDGFLLEPIAVSDRAGLGQLDFQAVRAT